jgi:hypothetical protein
VLRDELSLVSRQLSRHAMCSMCVPGTCVCCGHTDCQYVYIMLYSGRTSGPCCCCDAHALARCSSQLMSCSATTAARTASPRSRARSCPSTRAWPWHVQRARWPCAASAC